MFRKNVWIVNVVTILLFNTNIINAEEIKENIEEVKGYFFIGTSLNQVNFNIGEKSGGGKNLAGFRFGFGSKQKFSVRTEGELNFQNSYKSEISTRFYDVKFNLDIFAYNVNAYFDYDMENSNFKPYWGIGSGLTFIGGTFDDGVDRADIKRSSLAINFNLSAGVSYELTESFGIDFKYRFAYSSDSWFLHNSPRPVSAYSSDSWFLYKTLSQLSNELGINIRYSY